jgi:hypothetical protein
MTIRFYRQGDANNSSSSHSLIFTENPIENFHDEDKDFGWQHFTCSSREGKLNYLIGCLFESWSRAVEITYNYKSKDIDYGVVEKFKEYQFSEWMTTNFGEYSPVVFPLGTVDHQSAIYFPKNRADDGINIQFAKALINEFITKNYAVLGGNDNGDDNHPMVSLDVRELNALTLIWRMLKENPNVRVAYDAKCDHFVLTNGNSGNLMHIQL